MSLLQGPQGVEGWKLTYVPVIVTGTALLIFGSRFPRLTIPLVSLFWGGIISACIADTISNAITAVWISFGVGGVISAGLLMIPILTSFGAGVLCGLAFARYVLVLFGVEVSGSNAVAALVSCCTVCILFGVLAALKPQPMMMICTAWAGAESIVLGTLLLLVDSISFPSTSYYVYLWGTIVHYILGLLLQRKIQSLAKIEDLTAATSKLEESSNDGEVVV